MIRHRNSLGCNITASLAYTDFFSLGIAGCTLCLSPLIVTVDMISLCAVFKDFSTLHLANLAGFIVDCRRRAGCGRFLILRNGILNKLVTRTIAVSGNSSVISMTADGALLSFKAVFRKSLVNNNKPFAIAVNVTRFYSLSTYFYTAELTILNQVISALYGAVAAVSVFLNSSSRCMSRHADGLCLFKSAEIAGEFLKSLLGAGGRLYNYHLVIGVPFKVATLKVRVFVHRLAVAARLIVCCFRYAGCIGS